MNLNLEGLTFILSLENYTRIYKLISVPQVTRLLLRDAVISSKTDPHNDSKKEKRSYGKIKNNKNVKNLAIYSNSLS